MTVASRQRGKANRSLESPQNIYSQNPIVGTNPTMSDKILNRLLELVKEDQELHDAIVEAIHSKAEADRARAEWYNRRDRKP